MGAAAVTEVGVDMAVAAATGVAQAAGEVVATAAEINGTIHSPA